MAKKILLAVLLVAVAFASPAWADKKKDKTPTPLSSSSGEAAPKSVHDFGARWLAMSVGEKAAFVEGIATGFRVVCLNATMSADAKPKDNKEVSQRFVDCMVSLFPYKTSEVVDAMTALYQDKPNNILSWDLVYGIALVKIKGDPYEDNLNQLRQNVNAMLKNAK